MLLLGPVWAGAFYLYALPSSEAYFASNNDVPSIQVAPEDQTW
ncbi:MAG TPA: hypothetical protein VLU25_09260 [Acidobacteriota bacterium]|nr:hypothetical protein [Acidobacteriota bacterium]